MSRPFAEHDTSPEVVPKSEPADSPFPTPTSRSSMLAQPRRRQRDGDDEEDGYISIDGMTVNLGNSLFTPPSQRRRLNNDDEPPALGRRPTMLPHLNVSNTQESFGDDIDLTTPADPFENRPAYGKGPRLRPAQLDADQKRVVDLAIWGKKNVCSVGAAGTGKSETCEIIVYEMAILKRHVNVVAPSGTAAVNVHAQTLHSFFGLGKDQNRGIDECKEEMKATTKQRLRRTDVLIIDEISMVSYEMFDRMNELAKCARGNHLPFGGIQLMVFGDFCQLPPVLPHQFCYECGIKRVGVPAPDLAPAGPGGRRRGRRETDAYKKYEVWRCDEYGDVKDNDKMWAFKSSQWDQMNFEYIPLNQVHRQLDPEFLALLTKLRHGTPFTPDEISLLREHECDVTNAVQLEATKASAWKENSRRLHRLTSQEHKYRHEDDFVWQRELHPELADLHKSPTHALNSHAYEEWVHLKKGMPVILQKNISVEMGLVNGSQGVIDHFMPYDESQQPHDSTMEGGRRSQLRRGYVRDFMSAQRRRDNSTSIPVVKFNNVTEPVAIWPDCSVSERGFQRPHSLLIRTQIPLLAGWALTIHKAQGMTLQKAIVNLDHCWQSGMAYVALSRVKTLHGLRVEGLKASTINSAVDEEVKAFLEDKFGVSFD